jgi:hypothetical protein
MKHFILLIVVCLLFVLSSLNACRRVTLVGDSLFGCAQDKFVNAINSNFGDSWVYTQYVGDGCTAYNNPINQKIYDIGIEESFGRPDVVVFSFATNEMMGVTKDTISFESAIQSMQTLMNQAVVSGATCIVMLEASHRILGEFPLGARFEMHMDEWFEYWHRRAGDNEHLGIPYMLLIADISSEVLADTDTYIAGDIHFTEAGAELAANEMVEKINQCPAGRWIFGEDALKQEAEFPPNPYYEYKADE